MIKEFNYNLFMSDLPVINDIHDLSSLTHISGSLLYNLSANSNKYYKEFTIKKRNGNERVINAPNREMKAVQAWILRNILDKLHVTESATAYRKKKKIEDNIIPHFGNRYFLCVDIKEFFPSIKYNKVYTIYRAIGYNRHVSHILTSMSTYKNKLPQGAITSPSLSNIVCIRMDRRLSGYTSKNKIAYTRYADDMTFSSQSPTRIVALEKMLRMIITEEGFNINDKKTRHIGPRRCRKITGIVINDDTYGIGRKKRRELRAKIHKLAIMSIHDNEKLALRNNVDGWYAYLKGNDEHSYQVLRKYEEKMNISIGVQNP